MNGTAFNPNEWTYIPDSLGRLNQGYYQLINNPSQTLSVQAFQEKQGKARTISLEENREQKVNKNPSTSLNPWDNPVVGEQRAQPTPTPRTQQQQVQQAVPLPATPQQPNTANTPDNNHNPSRDSDNDNDQAPDALSDYDGGDNNDSDGSHLCTELYRQGLMSRYDKELNWHYAKTRLPASFLIGYQAWARHYVKLMRRSPLATQLIRPFVMARTHAIAHKLNRRPTSSLLGFMLCLTHDQFCCLGGITISQVQKTILKNQAV